jgi:hypothetical protein
MLTRRSAVCRQNIVVVLPTQPRALFGLRMDTTIPEHPAPAVLPLLPSPAISRVGSTRHSRHRTSRGA